jgi:pilus assembly protein CpaB
MKAKSIFLLALAAGCGLIASIGVSQVMDRKGGQGTAEETEAILVAASDVDIGKVLDAQNTKLEQWPKSRIPTNAIRSFDEVKDKFTASRLFPGEAILTGKITSDHALMPRIPEGFRVVPLKLESDTVLGLIQPGDQVDVMVFVRQQEGVPSSGAFTILQKVTVFTVNNTASREVSNADEKASERSLKTVSLLVKPNQAERLHLAGEVGRIRLSIRRGTDELMDEDELNARLPPIFRDGDHTAPDDKKKKPDPIVSTPQSVVPSVPLVSQPLAPVAIWKMQIHNPSEVKQFEWDKEDSLPFETSAVGQREMTGSPLPPEGAAFAPPVPTVPKP